MPLAQKKTKVFLFAQVLFFISVSKCKNKKKHALFPYFGMK